MLSYFTWLIIGLIFMAVELIVPGGIIVFLGLASVVVGCLIYLNINQGWHL